MRSDHPLAALASLKSPPILAGVIRDIADEASGAGRRLAEVEALSGIGSWEWEVAANRLEWSAQLSRIYGFDPAPLPRTYDDFIGRVHPADREMVERVVQGAFQSQEPFEMEHRIVHDDGSVRVIHSRGEVLLDASGAVSRMLGSAQDVTERRRADAERADEARRAAAGQARDDALALLAHDLRSPLAVIVGYAELLDRQVGVEGSDTAKTRAYLERLTWAARQMSSLLDDLLADASVQGLDDEMVTSRVDLVECVREVAAHHDATSAEHTITAAVPDEPVMVDVNVPKIERALHNLLRNAINYSPDGGPVRVGLERTAAEVRISVADEGLGIPEDDLPHIFERFHRGANAVGRTSGIGLGLISVQRAVQAHGGRVEVDSEVGRGTTFTMHLPAAR